MNTITGNAEITLPTDYSDLLIDIKINEYNNASFYLIKDQLLDTSLPYLCGASSTSSGVIGTLVVINASKTKVNLRAVNIGGTSFLSSSKITVFYKP